jgi:hypothetical protein
MARENRRQFAGKRQGEGPPRGNPKVHRKGAPNSPYAGKPKPVGKKAWPKKPRV